MRVRIILISTLGLVAVALLAAGCGGGTATGGEATGSDGTTGGGNEASATGAKPRGKAGALSKAEFIKKGDVICGRVPTEYNKLVKTLETEMKRKGQKLTAPERTLKAAVPPLYTAMRRLEKLPAPAGEEGRIEAIIAALESAAKGVEAEPKSELTGPNSPFAELRRLAGGYGFKFCGLL
jgi:hypothetical protein